MIAPIDIVHWSGAIIVAALAAFLVLLLGMTLIVLWNTRPRREGK